MKSKKNKKWSHGSNTNPSEFRTRVGVLAVPERSAKKPSQMDVFFSELEQWGRLLRNLS